MKTRVLFLVLLVALGRAYAQLPLKNNVTAMGLGFQSTATPQTSGWAEQCHRNPDLNLFGMMLPTFSCLATDYTGTTTNARLDFNSVLFYRKGWFGGTKIGMGAAMTANDVGSVNIGAAYSFGGWGGRDISKIIGIEGLHVVASVTWLKQDIAAASQEQPLSKGLRDLAERTAFRFGFAKMW